MTAIRISLLASVLLLAALAVACGDDDGQPSVSPTGTSPTGTPVPVGQLGLPDPWEIHIAAADGSGDTLAYAADRAGEFAWSPGGTELAIATGGFDSIAVRVAALDGTLREVATLDGGYSNGLTWSPDGRYLVTLLTVGTKQTVTAIALADGAQSDVLTVEASSYVLLGGWLPGGELLLEKGSPGVPGQLLALDVEAGTSRSLTELNVLPDYFGRPALSPDGRSLAVTVQVSDKGCGEPGTGNAIWTIDLETGATAQVSPDGYCGSGGMVWSPDGSQVAFSLLGLRDQSGVQVADIGTQQARKLADGLVNVVAWLDDGTILAHQYVCVGCDAGGPPKLLAIDSETGDIRELTDNVPTAVSPSGQFVAADGAIRVLDPAGATVREIAPVDDFWEYRSFQWSPTEKHVAYQRSHATGQHYYEVNADGSGFELVAAAESGTARLSPDGLRLAYIYYGATNDPKSGGQLWLSDADGSNARQVQVSGGVESFAWSPDSESVLFNANVESGSTALYVVGADGAAPRKLETSASIEGWSGPPVWSPDGRLVAFMDGDIIVLDVETGEVRVVGQTAGKQGPPTWSADSTRLIYGRFDIGQNGSAVVIINVDDGSSTTILDDDRYTKTSVILSPDGSQIAFLTSGPEKDTQVIVANADGTGETKVAQGPLLGSTIAWSPDGRWIAAPLGGETGGGLYLISPDGSETRQITRAGSINNITWLSDTRLRFETYQGGL